MISKGRGRRIILVWTCLSVLGLSIGPTVSVFADNSRISRVVAKEPLDIDTHIVMGDVKQISSSNVSAHLIKNNGSIWGWGFNASGQLGDGTTENRSIPVMVMASGAQSIASTSNNTYAIKNDGSLWGWGANANGQLGNGTTDESHIPIKIIASGVRSVSPSSSGAVYAIKTDGSLWAWGANWGGQLGDGTSGNQSLTPIQIVASGVKEVKSISSAAYAVKTDGSLWAWGGNSSGQVGDGTTDTVLTPKQIITSGVGSVDTSYIATYAVKTDGSLWAWGGNSSGQVGDGTNTDKLAPIMVIDSGVLSVKSTYNNAYAVKTDGSLWAWGGNGNGQIGNGTQADQWVPTRVFESGAVDVASTGSSNIALKSDGSIWTWGVNNFGQLGNGTNITPVLSPERVIDAGIQKVGVSFSANTMFAIREDGVVFSWGYNQYGTTGTGSLDKVFIPTVLVGAGGSTSGYESGTLRIHIKADVNLDSWRNASVHAESAYSLADSSYTYGIYDETCTEAIEGFDSLASDNQIDISRLPADQTKYCFVINYKNFPRSQLIATMIYQATTQSTDSSELRTPGVPNTGYASSSLPMLVALGIIITGLGFIVIIYYRRA